MSASANGKKDGSQQKEEGIFPMDNSGDDKDMKDTVSGNCETLRVRKSGNEVINIDHIEEHKGTIEEKEKYPKKKKDIPYAEVIKARFYTFLKFFNAFCLNMTVIICNVGQILSAHGRWSPNSNALLFVSSTSLFLQFASIAIACKVEKYNVLMETAIDAPKTDEEKIVKSNQENSQGNVVISIFTGISLWLSVLAVWWDNQ